MGAWKEVDLNAFRSTLEVINAYQRVCIMSI